MLELFEGLGVDTTLFQPLQPVFAREMAPAWWRDDPLFPSEPSLVNVRLCFNMERIGLRPVGNVREARLRDLWEAQATESIRDRMRSCTEGCGSMLCHAR